jgi:transglutaminase-like putative cysteine protease
MQTVIDAKIANPIELSMLYTGLLRASNIPARIVKGNTEFGSTYWVETYLNGKWGVASIVDEIRENSPSRLYFNMSRSNFYENFLTVDILPF